MAKKESTNEIGKLYNFRGNPVLVISEFKTSLKISKNFRNSERYYVLFPSGGIDVVLKDNLKDFKI